MELRSIDLMLEDWVTVKGYNNKLKIVAINGETITVADADNHDGLEDYPASALEGVSLTPEILEKNGFVPRGSGWCIPNTPRLDMGVLGFGIDDGCGTGFSQMPNGDFVFFSKYVHELQHALKLCGIDKEIEL